MSISGEESRMASQALMMTVGVAKAVVPVDKDGERLIDAILCGALGALCMQKARHLQRAH